jgi:hypothetical protein
MADPMFDLLKLLEELDGESYTVEQWTRVDDDISYIFFGPKGSGDRLTHKTLRTQRRDWRFLKFTKSDYGVTLSEARACVDLFRDILGTAVSYIPAAYLSYLEEFRKTIPKYYVWDDPALLGAFRQ